jgi:copper chaperone
MEEMVVHIPSISCGHCLATIQREIGEIDGVSSVTGDVGTRMVTIRWTNPASWDTIRETLGDIGFPPEDA